MKLSSLFSRKKNEPLDGYYENSTQKWLPIKDIKNGVVILKDGRYVKVLEVLPVNFYLKSETEQENIIYYFASYLKIAPDNMQIRVLTQKADIGDYLDRLSEFLTLERNDKCTEMIQDEMEFVSNLSFNVAVKKRFFIVFEFAHKNFNKAPTFSDVARYLYDEECRARKYLSQCGLEVLNIADNEFLIDLFYSIINKHTSKDIKPGSITDGMLDEIHGFEGGFADYE